MRHDRFFVEQPLGEELTLQDKNLIHQWKDVFRYKVSQEVTLFSGDGYDYRYSISSLSDKQATLSYISRVECDISQTRTVLSIAYIKKPLVELVVEKGTELGITDFFIFKARHSRPGDINEKRLHTIAQEASELSQRATIPQVHMRAGLEDVLSDLESMGIQASDIYMATHHAPKGITGENIGRDVAFFVGPEGGWSAEEENVFAQTGVTQFSLGKTILRAETAGIICAYLASNFQK